MYAGITEDDKYICKIKGFKDPQSIPFADIKSLLVKDTNLQLYHDKWYKSLIDGTIDIKKELFTLATNENKRYLIYKNNLLTDTKPFKFPIKENNT